MKVHAWCIDPNDIENKNTIKYLYPTGIKKCELLIIDTQFFFLKRRYQSSTNFNMKEEVNKWTRIWEDECN